MKSKIEILTFSEEDWQDIAKIYKEGIDTGMATFETKIPKWEQWNQVHIRSCRLKAVLNNEIIGWAALAPVSTRDVYRGVAEISIYITSNRRNLGVGKLLLTKLIEESEKKGFWTLQAGIFSNNKASIHLHTSLGFRVIGYREKIGKLSNIWYDNTILERRSKTII
ncbi:N-acetyltransferase family protein [Aquimarina sp. AD1]|uniref:GNAT family N-acetyltransferase n=1 Tax=Aquimarina sp. (strain AD1) TaxID=1714848 RepID=UPI000E501BC8|nr:GNAT family N-acetyltransferase [Aquimarina sp. AD1]AXT57621.1 N-acetyltransferase family protein [Aquimarina sp. AD1]RKN28280.1 GNAT family N-acetyltransferase [Aquimarina sp. AD1]